MFQGKARQLLSRYFPLIMVAVISAVVGGAITAHLVIGANSVAENSAAVQPAPVPTAPAGVSTQVANVQTIAAGFPGGNPDAVADVAEKVAPAVVKIETLVKPSAVQSFRSNDPFFNNPFFRQFFDPNGGDPFGGNRQQPYETGVGSGFIIDRDGYIVTNNHVVSGASEIKVYIRGHKDPFQGKVVGGDDRLDIAVVKIDPKGERLATVTFGDADKTRVGEWLIAIGNPFGMDWTVTTGVLSAKGRPLTINDQGRPHNFRNLLQTDAAINPGNSGGPLIDLKGDVIGINTAVDTQGPGIGFAIPVNKDMKDYVGQLKSGKPVTLNGEDQKAYGAKPWLGIGMTDLTPDVANQVGIQGVSEGVLITEIVSGSPADKAGLQPGDVIVGLKNSKVKTVQQILDFVKKASVGEKVALSVVREGRRVLVIVTLGSRPDNTN